MSIEILRGTTYEGAETQEVMLCNTTGWAFGPVMDEGEGELFIEWLDKNGHGDPRSIDDTPLGELWDEFKKGVATMVGDSRPQLRVE